MLNLINTIAADQLYEWKSVDGVLLPYGLKAVGGQLVNVGDYVIVDHQSLAANNGLYKVQLADWERVALPSTPLVVNHNFVDYIVTTSLTALTASENDCALDLDGTLYQWTTVDGTATWRVVPLGSLVSVPVGGLVLFDNGYSNRLVRRVDAGWTSLDTNVTIQRATDNMRLFGVQKIEETMLPVGSFVLVKASTTEPAEIITGTFPDWVNTAPDLNKPKTLTQDVWYVVQEGAWIEIQPGSILAVILRGIQQQITATSGLATQQTVDVIQTTLLYNAMQYLAALQQTMGGSTTDQSLQLIDQSLQSLANLGSGSGIRWVRPAEWAGGQVKYDVASSDAAGTVTTSDIELTNIKWPT